MEIVERFFSRKPAPTTEAEIAALIEGCEMLELDVMSDNVPQAFLKRLGSIDPGSRPACQDLL